jgi:hypothetical protein
MNSRARLGTVVTLIGLVAAHAGCGNPNPEDCVFPASNPSLVTVSAATYNQALSTADGGAVRAQMDTGQPGFVGGIEGAPCLDLCPGKETTCAAWVDDGGSTVTIECHPGCG